MLDEKNMPDVNGMKMIEKGFCFMLLRNHTIYAHNP